MSIVQPKPPTVSPVPHAPAALHPSAWKRAAQKARQWTSAALGQRESIDRRALLAGLLLCAVWTIELHIVQGRTLISPNELGPLFQVFAPPIRFVLDFLFLGLLVLWLPRRILAVVLVVSFPLQLLLVTYYHYFRHPLSLLTILNNWREGGSVGQLGIEVFPGLAALLLGLALAAKLVIVYWAKRGPLEGRPARRLGLLLLASYMALYGITLYLDPLHYIQTRRGVGRLGIIRGYLGPWAAEWYYLSDDAILKTALELRENGRDELSKVERPIPIRRRLIVIQAESLDYNVLGYRADGQEVTPFLNALRDRSMFYRVRAMHSQGSSDADFVTLFNARPSQQQNTYKIPGYPVENTLPQFLAPRGFQTWAFHGQVGDFYSRRNVWARMQFEQFNFLEELEERYGLPHDAWGVRDTDVLQLSQRLLKETPGRVCHFIITLTTHTPYTMLQPAEKRLFPQANTLAENYFNNMNYLDRTLQEYLAPMRDVTVLIYADHSTEVVSGGFRPDRKGVREWIPCFIYDSEQDLSQLQATRTARTEDGGDTIAHSGQMSLLDVTTFLRRQIAREFGDASSASDPSAAAPVGVAPVQP